MYNPIPAKTQSEYLNYFLHDNISLHHQFTSSKRLYIGGSTGGEWGVGGYGGCIPSFQISKIKESN